MKWTTDRIRQSFLDFFAVRGHQIVPSASLIPKGDPTLLFTNAGMVPFKDYFLGIRTPASRRVADCQKCLRISGKHNDLEAVGRDSYHHTFFEMLGNWSFGDYYKAEAIPWHWELVTGVWEIPADRLWATIYKDDDEAFTIWEKIPDLPPGRILRFGEKDNFWEMGETGPCGPCSEIHIDRGEDAAKFCTHQGAACGVNVDGCARFIELGNLVFIQYNRDAAGKLTPLPMRHVDTGTGLERVASVMQSLETGRLLGNYDIDVFQAIIGAIEEKVVVARRRADKDQPTPDFPPYGRDSEKDVSYRAIGDHSRTISLLIADGVLPGNTDREYVLRRLIRRSARHGRQLGIEQPFLAGVADAVIAAMGKAYPELVSNAAKIRKVVTEEETRFGETLDRGLEFYQNERTNVMRTSAATAPDRLISGKSDQRVLPGHVAFKLYDTYGFPLDLTEDLARRDGIEVDVREFNLLMDQQRERGRAARLVMSESLQISDGPITVRLGKVPMQEASSKFVGSHLYESQSEIVAADALQPPDRPLVIRLAAAETPFYPESGGQTGDRGVVETESGAIAEITDTRKHNGAIVHIGRILRGEPGDFQPGRWVKLKIDRERRDAAMLNHSATHILHYALREILGNEVHQAGSLVAPDRLRFDFNHQGAIAEGDLRTIEEEINARIRENAAVTVEEMAYDDALKAGALAFFGDKYGDIVRVVRMGDFSVELCGGTHVNRSGDIGLFKLEAESGVAAGVRRIEAYTGQGALDAIRRRERILDDIGGQLGAHDTAALDRLQRLLAHEKELEKKLRALEQKLVSGASSGEGPQEERVREVRGIKIVTRKVDGVESRALREMADRLRQKYGSAVVGLGSDLGENKAALTVAVTSDLAQSNNAGNIIKQIAPIVGGTGGGRPDFAQAGGRDASKLDEALERIESLVQAKER